MITSELIGTARRIKPSRSWSEPCALWTGVVSRSGNGKTPGQSVLTRALSFIERNRKDQIEKQRRAHETKAQLAKAAESAWKKRVEDAVEKGVEPPLKPPEAIGPGEFVASRLFISDTTIERLAVLLLSRPSGMLLICDELSRLFSNMSRYTGQDKEFWLESWNGEAYAVERQGRPPVPLDYLLVGITGGFQPDKLSRAFEGDQDGMYARFLFGWPREPDYQPLTDSIDEIEPDLIRIDSSAYAGLRRVLPRVMCRCRPVPSTSSSYFGEMHIMRRRSPQVGAGIGSPKDPVMY